MEIPYIETRWNYRGQNMIGEAENSDGMGLSLALASDNNKNNHISVFPPENMIPRKLVSPALVLSAIKTIDPNSKNWKA